MIHVTDEATLDRVLGSPLDPSLIALLTARRDQLLADASGYELGELAHFIVAEPGDAIAEIEAEANYPLITEPAFEWVMGHCGWFEAVTVLSDDGFGIVLLVPDREGVDPTLLNLLRDMASDTTGDQAGASLA